MKADGRCGDSHLFGLGDIAAERPFAVDVLAGRQGGQYEFAVVVARERVEAVSGKSVMDHREAQRMLKDVRRGHIKALIFSKLARLARNTRQLLEFADIFRAQEADLVSLQESIDTSTPAGRLFYSMIAAMRVSTQG